MTNPRVFVVQDPRRYRAGVLVPTHDLSSATRYGALVTILEHNARSQQTEQAVGTLRSYLKDFNDADSLLCVGDPNHIGWAMALAARANGGRVRTLKWEKDAGSYLAVTVQLWDEPGADIERKSYEETTGEDRRKTLRVRAGGTDN